MVNAVVTEQPFRLTQDDPVITEADGTADAWSDIFKYQVPNGTSLLLKPGYTFSAYLEDVSAQVGNSTCQVKIEKRDASGSDVLLVYGPALYLESKEFQELSKTARVQVPSGGVEIREREFLVIAVKDDGAIDASDSYFELRIHKVRKALNI